MTPVRESDGEIDEGRGRGSPGRLAANKSGVGRLIDRPSLMRTLLIRTSWRSPGWRAEGAPLREREKGSRIDEGGRGDGGGQRQEVVERKRKDEETNC